MKPQASITLEEVQAILLIWLALAAVGGLAALVLWVMVPAPRGRLLPPQRQRAVPWGLSQVGLVIVVTLFWEMILLSLFISDEQLVKGEVIDERFLWAKLAAFPLQVASILLLLHFAAGAQFYQLGLTLHRARKDLIAGYLFWLVLTPAVFSIHGLAEYLVQSFGQQIKPHPLEEFLKKDPSLWATAAAVLVAVLAAPVLEELLFRGVIQPWMVRSPQVADLVLLAALIFAIVLGISQQGWGPLLFLVTVGPGYLLFEFLMRPWLPRPGAARALYATALLFAAVHYDAWPAPIALFFLALGLGYLAYRTQSLIGPMLTHGLFNAVSAVLLILS